VKNIGKWLKLAVEVIFLPTYALYVLYDFLAGFEGYLVYLILIVGFLYDVAMGYGLFFTMLAVMLVFKRYGYVLLEHHEIFWIFTLIWFAILIYRGFSHFYIFMGVALFVWEVYKSARQKRLVY